MPVGDAESDGVFSGHPHQAGVSLGRRTLTTAFPFLSPAASLSAGIYGGAEEQL